jgi:hypothetical protein
MAKPEKVSIIFEATIKDKGVADFWRNMKFGAGTAGASIQELVNKVIAASGKIKTKLKDVGKEKDKLKDNVVNFGTVSKYVFGTVLGINAVNALLGLIKAFKNLIASSVDYAKELYKLGAGVRSLQKAGLDITMKGTLELIRSLRKEFGVFSTRELVSGVAQIQLLTRQFGFTSQEIIDLTKTVAALSVVLGKDFANTAASVALFLSSGYGEALQRAGIAVNRLAVVEEAHRMGIKKSYTALSELERSHAAFNLIQRQSKDILKELTDYQKTYVGQIEAQKAEIRDLKDALALGLMPVEMAWQKVLATGANILIVIVNMINFLAGNIAAFWIATFATIIMALQNFKNVFRRNLKDVFNIDDILAVWKNTFVAMNESIKEAVIKPIDLDALMEFSGLDAKNEELAKRENEAADNMYKIMSDLVDELSDLQKDYTQQSNKLWDKYVTDRNKLIKKKNEELVKEEADFLDDLAKLEKDRDKSIADAQSKAQKSLEKLNKDTRDKVANANKKARDDEEKAERDHQERLRKLQEDFLFSLEDALRERDARQVLTLIRRFNLDKEREDRAYAERLDEIKKHNQDELDEIRKNERDKRAEIQQSLQEQLNDIRANYEEKKAEREAQHAQEIQEIEDKSQADLDARKAQYEQELKDLQDAFWGPGGKLEELLAQWAKTNSVTEEQAKAITDVLKKYFGELGLTDTIFNYYKNAVAGIVANVQEQERVLELAAADALALQKQITDAANAAAQSITSLSSLPNVFGGTQPTGGASTFPNVFGGTQPTGGASTIPKYASGVSNMILTRPKLLMAGEVPERVDITPLSQLGSRSGGSATLRVALSEGLIAEIIDNTLDNVAEIVIER